MVHQHDIVIRGGLIVDGSGAAPFEADLAIDGNRIAALGKLTGSGREEIDARGSIVTPGFVDIHTHFDGQATWENRMCPSSEHGVTTAVMGNCGVGFAPCRPEDHDDLVQLMEGVEDIPGVVMTEGVPWTWESFGDYLDALGRNAWDIDLGTQVPHSPVRIYVMGQRGIDREPSTPEDQAKMRAIVAEGIRAGALGVSTSRSYTHRRSDGPFAASVDADYEELKALGMGLADAGRGVFQLIPELTDRSRRESEFRTIERLAADIGRPVSYTLGSSLYGDPAGWRGEIERIRQANARGLHIRGQTYPRPGGALMGLDLSMHPFSFKPSYRALAALPLGQRVAAMRDPEMRARLLSEPSESANPFLIYMASGEMGGIFTLGDPADYTQPPENDMAVIAKRRGVTLEEALYDALLEDDGHAILYGAGHYRGGELYDARDCLTDPTMLLGLGDGGAHYGMICDAAYPTFMLSYWLRDAPAGRGVSLQEIIRRLANDTARHVGLDDRGLLAAGKKADVNIIDVDRLKLYRPKVKRDLPAGGRRLSQRADGYVATIVSGQPTYRDGEWTGALPGALVRGSDPRVSAAA